MDGSLLIGLAGSHLSHCVCMSVTMDIRVQRTRLERHINRVLPKVHAFKTDTTVQKLSLRIVPCGTRGATVHRYDN